MTLVLGFMAGVLFSSGVWLVVTSWRSHRPVADEAEDWLRGR